jgi:hypothetical protein
VDGQLVHASVAFKNIEYKPRALLLNSEVQWDSLVDKGRPDGVSWAENWQPLLELDLFDPSLAEEVGRKIVAATGKAKMVLLERIPFLALTGEGSRAISTVFELMY